MTGAGADAVIRSRTDGGTVLVAIRGEIDMSNAEDVIRDLDATISNQATAAIVDLTDVSYIDSVGLRVLFNLAAQLRTAQIDLKLVAPLGSTARRVIDLSGLAAVVRVEPES